MKVFFDATVWCGALLRPVGTNAKLLDLAARGGPLRGVTSDVVLLEMYRHAVMGDLRGVVFAPEDVWDFVRAHEPLLEISQSPIGRSLPDRTDLHNLPITEIVYHLTGQTREELLNDLEGKTTLRDFDDLDLHVVAAAYHGDADAICTSDETFFTSSLGTIELCRPSELAAGFGL